MMHLALNYRRIDPSRGGAETYVADLCRRLVAAGHRVDLYADSWAPGAVPDEVRTVHVPAEGSTRWGRLWNFALNSEAALRQGSFDCSVGFINTWHHDVLIPQGGVHPASLDHNARRITDGWRRALYLGSKRANPKHWLYRSIERRQYDPDRRARVVAVSHFVRGHLETYYRVPRDRIRVIPNAIDAQRLRVDNPEATRRAFRAAQGLGQGDLVALFVANNFRLKGLGPLLRALRERLRRSPDARPVHLLVCGGGRPGPFLRMIEAIGLAGSVRVLGYTPDIRDAFHASDFFVLPSYYDPCSLVVFEALACGLPVITTACNGAGEVIGQGSEGFIIPEPDATDALIDALDRLADDRLRGAMAERAVALGRAQSFDRHLGRLLEVFEEVAAERRGPRLASRTQATTTASLGA